jgi:predicted nuclease of predicted toxin-antitoxin system
VKIKLDENLPLSAVDVFRDTDYDVVSVVAEGLSGSTDAHLLAITQSEERVLITLDLDFSDIRAYPPELHAGIIVLRPQAQDIPSIISLMRRLLELLVLEPIAHRLWIVDSRRVRIRQ